MFKVEYFLNIFLSLRPKSILFTKILVFLQLIKFLHKSFEIVFIFHCTTFFSMYFIFSLNFQIPLTIFHFRTTYVNGKKKTGKSFEFCEKNNKKRRSLKFPCRFRYGKFYDLLQAFFNNRKRFSTNRKILRLTNPFFFRKTGFQAFSVNAQSS